MRPYSPGRALRDARKRRQRMREPRSIEVAYTRGARSIFGSMRGIVAYGLLPILRAWTFPPRVDSQRPIRDDDPDDEERILRELIEWFEAVAEEERAALTAAAVVEVARPEVTVVNSGTIGHQMDWLELVLARWFDVERPHETLVEKTGQMVLTHSQRELERLLRIDIRREMPSLIPSINEWRETNVNLIETGPWAQRLTPQFRPTNRLPMISEFVETAHSQGWRVQEMQSWLQTNFQEMPEWRAELIARDQTLKLNGQLNEHRQRAVGIDSYIWTTAGDSRVRDRHEDLDGKTFRWDDPPEAGNNGERAHPGIIFQCRCQAVPTRPSWMDE